MNRGSSAIKNWARAVYAPISFSLSSGHLRSCFTGRPVDRQGRPIPWLTYPIIDFLSAHDYSGRAILEWGAGHSTLWWSRRAKSIVAYETDPAWYEWLVSRIPPNVDLRLTSDNPADFQESDLANSFYDVIVIDGGGDDRAARLHASLPHLAKSGAVIIDNTDHPRYRQMVSDLKAIGFCEVDFHGYMPVAAKRCTTSLFFNGGCFLIQ